MSTTAMANALVAHSDYYRKGYLRKNVSEATVMIFDGKDEDGNDFSKGVLLELDACAYFKPYVPAKKSRKGKEKETSDAPA
ncbi:hypothetical protein POSPLADRAFT_1061717 [Postia placenta MAD-698-R-SB12]|uniref:Uncharacterized protein n=1 Tax=Postia placenta MAD-698-R-SB12 TaxID=670580 RepID=A0A1X6MMD8_9APHY|nr:hypothetical protein POSPLADRAFT_1061717 [Postia placenta MAD-698-R-SB12]OSX57498.1 hypothetical protein POSPLADRAFT_1061717 [Postia placenta MAD-698-R-SB12]